MIDELCRKLRYPFKDKNLLKMALTHRSSNDSNNERLEFLGDSIVNCIIAEAVYLQFQRAPEGDLSRWRATLINRDTLADIGMEFDLGRYLNLGPGELKSGGRQRSSIVSCALEAIIGAIYLDSNFETVKACVLNWYEPLLQNLTNAKSLKDPKTVLQEYLQAEGRALPIYFVDSVLGESHQQIFVVSCTVKDVEEKIIGKGTSRRRAEQDAAEQMLRLLKS